MVKFTVRRVRNLYKRNLMMRQNGNRSVFSNIFAGCICSLMTVIASISYATLIFSGNCAGYLQLGITSALVSATVIGFFVALKSSSPIAIAGPDANISAIIAIIAAGVSAQGMAHGASSSSVFTMLWTALAVSSLLTGIFLFFVGRFHCGRWIRFIPYPVVGGFLAGTGWLLAKGSFKVMCGVPLSWKTLGILAAHQGFVHWMPGAVFAVVLIIVLRRFHHFLIMPAMLLAAIGVCHAVLAAMNIPLVKAMQDGWLLSSFPPDLFFRSFGSLSFTGFDSVALAGNIATIVALMIVTAIVILLNAASVELTTRRDVELDRELTTTGIANIVAAPLGALTGCTALSRTILNFKAGASNRISGIAAAMLCGILLLFGARMISLFPRPVLGGLLLYLGLSLLMEWVWDGWANLSRFDYFLVVAIIVIIALWGFLPGVGIGVVIACMLFAINYSKTGVIKRVFSRATCHSNVERAMDQQELLREKGDAIYIVQLRGYIFFGTAYPLLTQVQRHLQSSAKMPVRFVVLDFTGVNGLDSSSTLSFSKLLQYAQGQNVTVLFVNVQREVEKLLKGAIDSVGPAGISPGAAAAMFFPDLDYALGWCEDKILSAAGHGAAGEPHTFTGYFASFFTRPELIPRLMNYLERLEVKAGFVLFEQGAPSTNCYFVESGEVTALLKLPENNGHKRLSTMSAGTVIGEMGLYLGTKRSATAVAEKESVLFRLSAESLKTIEEKDLELAAALHRFFVRLLATRLVHANEEMAFLLG
jgi:Sulfate permease and related transporters (MFS superfamily)